MRGFQGEVFRFSAIIGELGFFAKKSALAMDFLLEFDTSLAIATSGRRTILLLQESDAPPSKHPPHDCPDQTMHADTQRHTTNTKSWDNPPSNVDALSNQHASPS